MYGPIWLITLHTVRRAVCEFCFTSISEKVSMQLASLSSSPCAALSHPPASNGQSVISLDISSSFLTQRALSSCKSLKVELSECGS